MRLKIRNVSYFEKCTKCVCFIFLTDVNWELVENRWGTYLECDRASEVALLWKRKD